MAVNASLGRANVAIRGTLNKLDSDLSSARGKVDSAVQKMGKSAGKSFQMVGKAALGGIGVATAAVGGLATMLGKVTIDAAPVEGIQASFEGLAESAGTGMDDMLAALEKGSAGMVSQRDLMLSFNKAAGLVSLDFAKQLPDAMGYLGKVSAATGQDMSFMMDSLVTGVGRLSPMILDNLGIQVSLAEATERASEMYGVEADALSKAQQQAGMMDVVLGKLAKNTADMPEVTETATAKIAQMKAQFQNTKDEIGLAFGPVLKEVMDIISEMAAKYLPPLVDALKRIAPVVKEVVAVIGDFFGDLAAGEKPMDAFETALYRLVPAETADKIMAVIVKVGVFKDKVMEALAPILTWIEYNVVWKDVLIVLAGAIATVVVPALLGLLATIAPIVGWVAVAIAAVALLRQAWENDFLGIRTFVQETVEKIRAWWAENGDAIIAKGKEIWQKVVNTFNWFKERFKELFAAFRLAREGDWHGFGEKLREIWDAVWKKIGEIVSLAWEKIQDGLSKAKERVLEKIKSITGGIKDRFEGMNWWEIGWNIILGIADGINAGVGKIKAAAREAAQAALDAAKGFLGIHSPSQVFEMEIAGESVAGWVSGLDAGARKIGQASERLAMASVPSVGDFGGGQGAEALLANQQMTILGGLNLHGVEDKASLLEELWEMGR